MDSDWIKDRRFSSLSIKDLLEAREAYHVHLAHLDNVFATGIGRYLIRRDDADSKDPSAKVKSHSAEPRTLRNSGVQPWSWPCILVFVDQWAERKAFADKPDAMVPRFLYLPDGRVVPTCVVFADPQSRLAAPAPPPIFPSDLLGGGYPALQEVQGRERLSSMGCLVTDGDQVFVLTNRHVTGEAGRAVRTVVAGRSQKVGRSAGRDLGKKKFSEVYEGWQGSRVLLNLDAGLVRIDDVNRWTAQVYGVGELGPIWDLNVDTFNLDVIGCPVSAFGAAGGALQGQIQALFFRYKTRGGFEYVSDFLIGPREGEDTVGTRAGDSGTIWFEDPPLPKPAKGKDKKADKAEAPVRQLRPFAMQWGGQTLSSPGSDMTGDFALATCLSTICRELDVEVITDWNLGQPETWGKLGHFKVGALACELVDDAWLRKLFLLNQANIGYSDAKLQAGLPAHPKTSFVPLADVADFVWRSIRQIDDNNHFADIDKKAGSSARVPAQFRGKSLLELTKNKPANVNPGFWNSFYAAIGESKRGALPFRVWQIYDEMTGFAREGDLLRFICAGGLMAHYVGDACQPLHVSELHHGAGEAESGVHNAYEAAMLDQHTDEMLAALGALRPTWPAAPVVSGGGHKAAVAVVELMRRTVTRLPPRRVVDTYTANTGRGRSKAMWRELGDDTAKCLFDGSMTLARLWEGAWTEGRAGAADPALPADPCRTKALMDLYVDDAFLQSYRLQDLTEQNGRLVPI